VPLSAWTGLAIPGTKDGNIKNAKKKGRVHRGTSKAIPLASCCANSSKCPGHIRQGEDGRHLLTI
jgi:hypothetical protein